jgi:hypothetical protein
MSAPYMQPDYAARERFVTGASSALTCCAEASPVRTSVLPDAGKASMARGLDSGLSLTDSLASYDRASSLWRTCQPSLLGDLDEFLETWPRAGSMRNGIAFPRLPLAPLTRGTDSGLWRTPQAGEGNGGGQDATKRVAGGHSVYLRDQVKTPNWPTPRAEFDSGRHKGKPDTLHSAVKTWPTPTVQDASNNGGPSQHERNSLPLNAAVGGSLNPTWVEWLMGYPAEWTACEGWGTRSSRKSRNGSAADSSKACRR